jgi:ribosome-binding factor A
MRSRRVAKNLKRELARIVQESSDPRFLHITITDAEVTRDLKYATIYYTTMGHPESGAALRKASGYIKNQLAQRLMIRFIPELRFKEDKSYEYGRHIDEIIDNIKGEKGQGTDPEE